MQSNTKLHVLRLRLENERQLFSHARNRNDRHLLIRWMAESEAAIEAEKLLMGHFWEKEKNVQNGDELLAKMLMRCYSGGGLS